MDKPESFPYVLRHRQRSPIDTGPCGSGKRKAATSPLPIRADIDTNTFRGLRPLGKQPAGRFAVLSKDLRVLYIVVNREGMRRRWSGKLRV